MAARPAISDTLLRHQVLVQGLSTNEVNQFAPFLRKMDKAVREELSGDELTEFNRTRLNTLLRAVDDLLAGILTEFSGQLLLNLESFAQHEATFSDKVIAGFVDTSGVPADSTIRTAILKDPLSANGPNGGKLLETFIDDWSTTERKAITGAIRAGVFHGKTNAQIVKSIRGSAARNYNDGILNLTRRHADAIVRTAVQHVSSMARQAVIDKNADVVEAEQWLATLDKRTCAQCRSLDRQIFAIGKGPRTPIHINCRCVRIPVLKDEFAALSKGATRASKGANGGAAVDGDVSYYEWLQTQPESFQVAVLGKTRAKLFRDGGLSPTRFAALQLDKNFGALTLDEMKALDPLAFEEAGL